jgi:hypothetical protein
MGSRQHGGLQAVLVWPGLALGTICAGARLWLNRIFSRPASGELVAISLAPIEALVAFIVVFGLMCRRCLTPGACTLAGRKDGSCVV